MTVPKSDSDVCTGTDARAAVPTLRTWADGDEVTADALNYEWRDTLNWLLGSTKPAFVGYGNSAVTLTLTPQILVLNTEVMKRGGIVHGTNDSRVFVPEEGWYCGSATTSLSQATTTNRFSTLIFVNGVQAAHHQGQYVIDWTSNGGVSFEIYCKAGSYVQIAIQGSYTSGAPRNQPVGGNYASEVNPRLEMWWSHRNS